MLSSSSSLSSSIIYSCRNNNKIPCSETVCPSADGSSTRENRWCRHLAIASEAAMATASLPFRTLPVLDFRHRGFLLVFSSNHMSRPYVCCGSPLSSDRLYLSYGVCLEVRGEIIRTVLCCIVYDSCAQLQAHLDEQFLQFSGLGFVILDAFHCA